MANPLVVADEASIMSGGLETAKTLVLILISIAIGIGGQFCLKHGVMETAGRVELVSLPHVGQQVLLFFGSPFIWGGLMLYAFGAVTWMVVLSRADISFAYPMLGLAYVLAVVLAYVVRHEAVTPIRWLGVLLIAAGVMFIGNELVIREWVGRLLSSTR